MTLRELVALTRKTDRWNIIQHAAGPDLRRHTTKLRDEALERILGERDE